MLNPLPLNTVSGTQLQNQMYKETKPHEEELTETEDQQRFQIPATGITRYTVKITVLLCSKREKTV